ncbi:MAG: hypothetical protein JNL80_11300 [Phycisphaerae bacterium]|nr:hypothetical protein [Phycisphaerae bacterium]
MSLPRFGSIALSTRLIGGISSLALAVAAAHAGVSAPPRPDQHKPDTAGSRSRVERAEALAPIPTDVEAVPFGESRLNAATLSMMVEGSVIELPSAFGPVRMKLVERTKTYLGSHVYSFVGDPTIGTALGSEARIVVSDGQVGGFIRARDGFEAIVRPLEDARQSLTFRPFGPAEQDGCQVFSAVAKAGQQEGEGGIAGGCADAASMQDVLVIVTPAAIAENGGSTATKILIEAAMVDTNTALKNSENDNRVRLVEIFGFDFPESGDIGTDLDALRVADDGVGDFIHTLRDLYAADLVQLVADTAGACGVAYLFDDDESYGFSVVADTCLGSYVPAHELGHNFGCCHAVGDGGGCDDGGYFPYSNGYRFTGGSSTLWRTVMAYDPGTRIPYFSNPSVFYDGHATGVAGSTSAAADNSRTIDLTALAVSNFRCSDEPTVDCNSNGIPDIVDVIDGTSEDCNENGAPDECDIALGFSEDEDKDGVPDECGDLPSKFYPNDAGDSRVLDAAGFSAAMGRGLVPSGQTLPLNAVLGAYGDDEAGANAGAAYVFNSAGTQQAKLTAADPDPGANFGRAVDTWSYIPPALAPKREFAVVGAYRADVDGDLEAGMAYVFSSDNDGAWLERKALAAADGKPHDWFGFSVNMTRIPADSNHTLFVGAPQGNSGKGAVYIYRYLDANTTTLSKKIVLPQSSVGADFGWSLASDNFVTLITQNPVTLLQRAILVAGAPGFDDDTGRVRAYERTISANSTFPSTGATIELSAGLSEPGDRFGEAVAIADNWLAIGAPGRDGGRGAVYVYERTNLNQWQHRQTFTLSDASPSDRFGASVSISIAVDGAVWLAAGAPRFDQEVAVGTLIDSGLGFIRRKPAGSLTWSAVNPNMPTDTQGGDQFGTSCSIFNDGATIRALFTAPFDDDTGLNSGSAYFLLPTLP